MRKSQLGQFFTTNSDYILQGFEYCIKGKTAIDPFAGNGDLINWAKTNSVKTIKGFDVDCKYIDNKIIYYNDSIKNHLKYNFVITNPPYLNVNKADQNTKGKYFRFSEFEDLYQIAINSILNSDEGILIVPINFLCANNSRKTRKLFFNKFKIVKLNYFKKPVFDDTTYNVASFYYIKKQDIAEERNVFDAFIYPEGKKVEVELEKKFDWTICGNFVNLINHFNNYLKIRRLTEKDLEISMKNKIKRKFAYNHVDTIREFSIDKDVFKKIEKNIILLKAIDSGTEKGKISLENIRNYNIDGLISKESSRHMIQLIFEQDIGINEQEKVIEIFNEEINKMRNKYLSLFLTNYRDNDRKRISFDFVYRFINYLYFNKIRTDKITAEVQLDLFGTKEL